MTVQSIILKSVNTKNLNIEKFEEIENGISFTLNTNNSFWDEIQVIGLEENKFLIAAYKNEECGKVLQNKPVNRIASSIRSLVTEIKM